MKKIYFTLLCVLLAGGIASAQNFYFPVWEEHFTESTSFSKWTVSTLDLVNKDSVWRWNEISDGQGHPGFITGEDKGIALVPANKARANTWLVSEGIPLQQGVAYTINFSGRTNSAANAHLSFYIGTNSTFIPNTPPDSLWVSPSSGANWTKREVTFTPTSTSTYYLGFHAWTTSTSTNAYIGVDGISVNAPTTNNITLIPSFPSPYTQIPISQNKVIAKAANTSSAPSTNVTLSATVNTTTPVGPTSPGATVSGTDTTELSIADVPYIKGDNTVNYALAATADQYAGDNTATHTFKGTSVVYATDALAYNVEFSGTTDKDTLGNIYKIVTPTKLTGVALGAGYHGTNVNTFDIILYRLKNGNEIDGEPVFTQTLTKDAAFGLYTFPVSQAGGIVLTEGDYFLAVATDGKTSAGIAGATAAVTGQKRAKKAGNTVVEGTSQGTYALRLLLEASDKTATVTPVSPIPEHNSVFLQWTKSSDDVYQSKVVLTPASGAATTYYTYADTITVSNLPLETEFTWSVTPFYDALHEGALVEGTPFTTLADPAVFTSENFNGNSFPPSLSWTSYGVTSGGSADDDAKWTAETDGSTPTATPIEGSKFIQFNSSTLTAGHKGVLITPEFTYVAGQQFSFWAYRDAANVDKADSLNIYLTTRTDITDLTPIATVYRNNTLKPAETAAGWYYYTVDLTDAEAGSQYRIALEGVSDNGGNIYVDGISVHAPFPAVTYNATSPADDDADVALSGYLTVTFGQDLPVFGNTVGAFSEEIAQKLITIKDNATSASIEVTAGRSDERTLRINHAAPFIASTTYNVHVPKAAIPGLTTDVDWSFTTIDALAITAHTPAADATDVTVADSTLTVTFNRAPNLSNAAPGSITLKAAAEEEGVHPQNVVRNVEGTVATIIFPHKFAYNTVYTVTIPGSALANASESLRDTTWTFTTEVEPLSSLNVVKASSAVYPILSQGTITVNTTSYATVKVADFSGKVLAVYSSTGHLPINLNYANGLYLIVVENGEGVTTHKVVLQK
ncbi:MAG: hypothetical protein EZS26_001797 [Candidatus Ordinivivax streblomastigis]|uniref:MAM domain-containing protein n=1 Tax=Candidatus Ordinivivax streblomastigis TaxID=2540710 RepID=A0A5M8P0Q3_9BACT|nr:MAG: hypothetical protein EZS26_001797 [Candidatus Ordinivivax streblomastigis]